MRRPSPLLALSPIKMLHGITDAVQREKSIIMDGGIRHEFPQGTERPLVRARDKGLGRKVLRSIAVNDGVPNLRIPVHANETSLDYLANGYSRHFRELLRSC